jgi:hypothetical protein
MMSEVVAFLGGVYACGAFAIAVVFRRMFIRTSDRFFAWFAGAFALLALERVLALTVSMHALNDTASPYTYGVRLLAFILILIAITGKNRQHSLDEKKNVLN